MQPVEREAAVSCSKVEGAGAKKLVPAGEREEGEKNGS